MSERIHLTRHFKLTRNRLFRYKDVLSVKVHTLEPKLLLFYIILYRRRNPESWAPPPHMSASHVHFCSSQIDSSMDYIQPTTWATLYYEITGLSWKKRRHYGAISLKWHIFGFQRSFWTIHLLKVVEPFITTAKSASENFSNLIMKLK